MSRIKIKPVALPVPRNRTEAEAVARHLALCILQRRALESKLDETITRLKAAYEGKLATVAAAIQPRLEAILAWAEANPHEFAGKRSTDLLHAVVGWRLTPPAVKPRNGYTWAAVLEAIKTFGWLQFIRTKEEINKEAILAHVAAPTAGDNPETDPAKELARIGVQVVQVDEFFVEPKLTDPETHKTTT